MEHSRLPSIYSVLLNHNYTLELPRGFSQKTSAGISPQTDESESLELGHGHNQ